MLMAHAEKLAASSNFEQVKLYTNKLFVENVQFYIRLGYSVDREGAVVSGIKGHVVARSVATIAVGTLISERPPHRSVRAAFPHTAPTSGE